MPIMLGRLALGLGIAAFSAAAAYGAGRMTLYPGAVERICLCSKPPDNRLPVLVIYAVKGEVEAIRITAERGEEALVGLYPGGPFTAETSGKVRRSFMPGEASRCWHLALEGEGTAEVAVELFEPLSKGGD